VVKETIDEYQRKQLACRRRMQEMKDVADQVYPRGVMLEAQDAYYQDIYIRVRFTTEIVQRAKFISIVLPKKMREATKKLVTNEKTVARLFNIGSNYVRMVVTDKEYYAMLKEVAEKLPWVDEIEKSWKFDVNEYILTEKEIPSGMPGNKRKKPLKETVDVGPRYEKLEERK
jgi:hypothetical protein